MSDSNALDGLDAEHERNREQRLEGIKRWVEYIESEPPETWGPQLNAIVDDQLEAAQSIPTSASHRQHVEDVATAIVEERDGDDDTE
jgi:hypothetical protein